MSLSRLTTRSHGRGRRCVRPPVAAAAGHPELLPHGRQRVLRPHAMARQPCAPSHAVCCAVPSPPVSEPRAQAGTSSPTAIALAAECRIRVSTGLSCSPTAPSTAMSRPVCPPSCSHLRSMCGWLVSVSTASCSSRGAVSADAAPCSCQVPPWSAPAAVTRRTAKPRCTRCTATEAAIETACSSEDAAPVPRCAIFRLSRNSVARDCQGCSSRRTISSPACALLRQCTRRRSSPRRYSRTVTSSALPLANARGRLSPEPVHTPDRGTTGSGTTRGVTTSDDRVWKVRSSSTRPNGSDSRTFIGPTSNLPRTSERTR